MSSIDRRNGRWRARWRTPDGSSRTKTFDRRWEAQAFLHEIEHSKSVGGYVDPQAGRVTFEEYAEEWRRLQVHHRPGTALNVERLLRVHAYPVFGYRPIAAIRPAEVQAWVKGLTGTLAPSTVKLVYGKVATVMRSAVRDRIIPTSPCVGIKLPRIAPSSTERLLTVEEVGRLAEVIAPDFRAYIILGAGSGLRPSELLGLTVDRVDFLRRTVKVDRQLDRWGQLAPPKTDASYRTIPLGDVVLETLAAHLADWPAGGAEGWVFHTKGRPIQQSSRFSTAWARAREAAGIEWGTPHDLRHFYASLLIAHGASVKVVQKRMGHTSAATTLNIYAHLWPDSEDLTRQAVDAELSVLASSRVPTVSRADQEPK